MIEFIGIFDLFYLRSDEYFEKIEMLLKFWSSV